MSAIAVIVALGVLLLFAGFVTRQTADLQRDLAQRLDAEGLRAVPEIADALRERVAGSYLCRLGHGWSSSMCVRWSRGEGLFQAGRLSFDRGFGLRTERRNVLVMAASLSQPTGRWLRLPSGRPTGEPEYDFYTPFADVPTLWTLDGGSADAERIGRVFETVGESLLATASIEAFDQLLIVWWEDVGALNDAGGHVLAAAEFQRRLEARSVDAPMDQPLGAGET